jgi:Acetyltransferase (GNAT) domain
MLVLNFKHLWFKALQVWWPDSAMAVYPLLEKSPVVILWQCPKKLVGELQPYVFRTMPFWTPLVDLCLSEDELWQQLDAKSCRYEIRKARKLETTILRNEEMESARLLINESIRRLRYRAELGPAQWQEMFPLHELFICKWDGTPVAAHVILPDHPGRARLLLSGTVDRDDPRYHNVVGPLNRLLHWAEFQHYKANGFRYYDFGGCELDRSSPSYPVTDFKLSFGAQPVEEPMIFLAKNPLLRTALRMASDVRAVSRNMPWPKGLIRVIKQRPKLGSLFR